jgi:hypothetical protein
MSNSQSIKASSLELISQSWIPSYEEFEIVRQKLANFILLEGHEATDEDIIRDYLVSEGYTEGLVEYTCAWLENVVRSGKATETLDMIQQKSVTGIRIENPFDRPYISDPIWNKIESWRIRGILPADVVERLLVGLRNMDVRDWEEEDVNSLVANLIAPAFDEEAEQEDLMVYESKISEEFYC